jgi:hypothetical protein
MKEQVKQMVILNSRGIAHDKQNLDYSGILKSGGTGES